MLNALFKLILRIRRFVIWIWRQEGTPSARARGIALGVFSGCFPFFGFQTLIGIFLARICKGNLLLAAAATWVSNPFTYIPLFWLNYKIGEFYLGVGRNIDNLSELSTQELFSQGWILSSRILLGSTIVGLLLGLLSGTLFFIFFKRISLKDSMQ